MNKIIILIAGIILCFLTAGAQIQSSEDSVSIVGKKPATYLGGYGNVLYQYNSNEKNASIDLERAVIFIGHRFDETFSFFSELEIEDAKVSGGEAGGEVAFEQLYVKLNVNRNSYFKAGLFLPRIGILNENHLPNTFNGNERTQLETYLIPSTWRELGVGFYTQLNSQPVNISVALVNGLNCEGFEHGSYIREGRYEGRNASANSLAVTGAVQYSKYNFTFQVSAYAGGSAAVPSDVADSLQLKSGPFGTPVILSEADVIYSNKGFSLKLLGVISSVPDAFNINRAYSNNTPESANGFYAEAGYDFFSNMIREKKRSLIGFVRYEKFDLNAKIPENGITDQTLNQQHIITGISYFPIPNIAIKADVRLVSTGDQNPLLSMEPYKKNNSLINLGIGFSF